MISTTLGAGLRDSFDDFTFDVVDVLALSSIERCDELSIVSSELVEVHGWRNQVFIVDVFDDHRLHLKILALKGLESTMHNPVLQREP